MAQHTRNTDRQLAEIQAAVNESGESTFEGAKAKAKLVLEKFNNVTLNIAVTGVTGAGKSSLVNALRGVGDDDEGAAPTGVCETTMTPTKYPHPKMPNVNIWDLPGIGTPNFTAKKYIEDVNFNTYDVFFILTSTRLMENDIMLAKEIKKNKKNFYFIRTKIDQDVEAEKRRGKTEEQTLSHIQKALEKKLKDFSPTHIFLVSSWHLNKFYFNDLTRALEKDLPEHKRNALIQSLPVYSKEILDEKYNRFKKQIWAFAFASGAVGAVPFPGVSVAFDIPLIIGYLTKVYFSFGLDEKSLKKLSVRVNKEIHSMIQNSKLIKAIASRSAALLAVELAGCVTLEGIEEALKVIPIFGSLAGAGMSFATTLLVLRKGLNELYKAAKAMVEMAGLD